METPYTLVTREEWQARPPRMHNALALPVPYVVIHHSYQPPVCYTKELGCQAMRQMQNFHMDHQDFVDIGYNFAVGGDGIVYEGRGWKTLAAHTKNFNHVSFGICLIGDWQSSLPPPSQLQALQDLLKTGVRQGYLKPDYSLIGHRQVRATECPGHTLFEHIKTWDHYSAYPASVADLLDIKGIPENIRNELSTTVLAMG